jgi:hypothetical protein
MGARARRRSDLVISCERFGEYESGNPLVETRSPNAEFWWGAVHAWRSYIYRAGLESGWKASGRTMVMLMCRNLNCLHRIEQPTEASWFVICTRW